MRADESELGMFLRWHLYRRWKKDRGRASMYEFRRRIKAAPPGRLAVDCGANAGDVTAVLLKEGYRVIAFEPDPISLAALERRFAGEHRVTIVPKAVGASARTMPLYREIRRGRVVTEASSFVKLPQHQPEPVGDIEVIDLVQFLRDLGEPVDVLKVDIEGAEAELLEAMLERDGYRGIGRIYVETHEWLDEALAARLKTIRRRVQAAGIDNIDLDWG